MEKDNSAVFNQANCNHEKEQHYISQQLDALNGFDLTLTRCIKCHKVLVMEVKNINSK